MIQAAKRRSHVEGCPKLLFLHGNVLHGYCAKDSVHGVRGAKCSRCGQEMQSVRLLYPIQEKDYKAEPGTRSAWDFVKLAFEDAFMVTIFGYSAPASDRAAVELLQAAWGSADKRYLEQFEVIDIRDEDSLRESWKGFIHTHHYEIHSDFFDSWIAHHARRTGEAYWDENMEAAFIDDNPVIRTDRLDELRRWFTPLIEAEHTVTREA